MSVFVVQAKVRQECVPDVEAGIEKMVRAIEEASPEGFRYAYGKLPDGVSFLAILELANPAENPMFAIPACREFKQNLDNHWMDQSQPPAPQPLEVVGSYRLFGWLSGRTP